MKETIAWLTTNDDYVVVTHERPDGDALGSAAALCEGLRYLGKTAYVAQNPEMTERYKPYIRDYLAPEGYMFRHVIAVDTPTQKRIQKAQRNLAIDLAIDHHIAVGTMAPLHWTDPDRGACGEMIYDILTALGVPLTPAIALPLYLSLATDTGCFRQSNTTAGTHEIAAALLRTGIDITTVNTVMFDQKSRARLKIEARIYDTLRYHLNGKLTLGVLSLADIQTAEATEDDLDSLSALPRRVQGSEIGLLLREEKPNSDGVPVYKVSVRTSKDWRADLIAAQFGGGGHARAAGATIEAPLETTVNLLLNAVREVHA